MINSNIEELPYIVFTHKEYQKYLKSIGKSRRGNFYCKKCGDLTSSDNYKISTVHLLCGDCNDDRLDFGL